MMSVGDRRHIGVRARLARLFFALGRACAGVPSPRYYEKYAQAIPAIDVIDLEVSKVLSTGDIQPDTHRDALLRLATQVGRSRREGVIMRLALHDAGILILPPEEIERIKLLYKLEDLP